MRKGPGYSYERITKRDLFRLLEIAQADRNEFFSRRPRRKSYRYRSLILCTALCQGAALHYVHGENGIKDFTGVEAYREERSSRVEGLRGT
jgi:hypothetical protein